MATLKTSFAVILAGGKGTRLGSITQTTPKPLVEVVGRPFLEWQLLELQRQGVRDVLLLVSHLSSVIQEHFARRPLPGLRLSYSVEPVPLGTGGALRLALPLLPEWFWLLNGDSFLPLNLLGMEAAAGAAGGSAAALACMAVVPRELVPVAGNVRAESGRVLEYRRDAGLPWVDAGVALLSREVVARFGGGSDDVGAGGEAGGGGADVGACGAFDLGELWLDLIAARALRAHPVDHAFFDIGTPERLGVFADWFALAGRGSSG